MITITITIIERKFRQLALYNSFRPMAGQNPRVPSYPLISITLCALNRYKICTNHETLVKNDTFCLINIGSHTVMHEFLIACAVSDHTHYIHAIKQI